MTTTESEWVNGVFEGTSFDAGAEYLYVSVEEPLCRRWPSMPMWVTKQRSQNS